MNARELNELYLRRSGLHIIPGLEKSLLPLAPYLLMDVALSVWTDEIAPVKFDRKELNELARAKDRWEAAYNLFNRTFFATFKGKGGDDREDEVIAFMDSFSEYIANQVTVTKVQAMDIVKGEDLSHQRYVSSLLVCNALSFYAETVWRELYRRRDERMNNQLMAMTSNTRKMAELYMRDVMRIGNRSYDNDLAPLKAAMNALQHAILRWLHRENEQIKNNDKNE